jgi:hypothetical protein
MMRHEDLLEEMRVGEFLRVAKLICPQDGLHMFEVSLGLPGVFCCGVPLSGYQVLPPAFCSAVGQDLVQFKLLFSADKVTRGVRIVRAVFCCLLIGRLERSMEDIVDLPSRWKPQLKHHRGDDLCYFKWTFPSGGQLLRGVTEPQVAPFKPYLISDFPWTEFG